MNLNLSDPAFWSRLQFGFTVTYHYLFPQLTMGLAWFPVYWKWRALRTGEEEYNYAVRFWAKLFGLNFAVVASNPKALRLAAGWWPVGFALAATYCVFVSRRYAGKVSVRRDTQGFY
jgi:hypothetical protein